MARGGRDDAVEQAERGRVAATEPSWALRDVNRAAAEVDHVLARRIGLRALDYGALSHIMSADGTIGPYELSTRLGISTGSATELVDRLERAGHVERRRDVVDRRRVELHATDSAARALVDELTAVFSSVDDLAGDFTEAEQTVITRYLRRAAEILWSYTAGGSAD